MAPTCPHSRRPASKALRAGVLVVAGLSLRGLRLQDGAGQSAFVGKPASPPIAGEPTAGGAQAAGARQPGTARSARAQPTSGFTNLDSSYNPTWLEIEEKPATSLQWLHPQTAWAAAASALYVFDMWRIFNLIPPTVLEVVIAAVVYLGLYCSRLPDVSKLDKHYQVSFYASCGWTIYAVASLSHALAYGPHAVIPLGLAEAFHTSAALVYLASCAYFYQYHWGRQIRHLQEGRFRPMFAAGLASLTFAHGLTVGHIFKMFEDPGWFETVAKIYPDQWQWIADTRLLELYLTALALFLVILHLRGVLTGTKNAIIVFLWTVIIPTAALMFETFFLHAVAWEHYFMVGPKHF